MRSPRLLLAVLLTALVTVLGLTTAPATAAPTRAAVAYETQAHHVTNQKRANHNRRALTRNACLVRMARAQARRMAARGDIYHQDLGRVQRQCGMGWVGENVAYGYRSGRSVVEGWMDSPGHRENILRPQFRQMGLGAVARGGTWYVAQVFGAPA
jgi:uncharacterized protein YkwD